MRFNFCSSVSPFFFLGLFAAAAGCDDDGAGVGRLEGALEDVEDGGGDVVGIEARRADSAFGSLILSVTAVPPSSDPRSSSSLCLRFAAAAAAAAAAGRCSGPSVAQISSGCVCVVCACVCVLCVGASKPPFPTCCVAVLC